MEHTMHAWQPTKEERDLAYRLAIAADVDHRTALRALRLGPECIRVASARRRLVAALALLTSRSRSAV